MLWLWVWFTVLAWAGPPEPIGMAGSTLDLPAGWSREGTRVSPSSFVDPGGTKLLVEEHRGVFSTEGDHRRWMEFRLERLRSDESAKPLTEVVYEVKDGVGHAWQRWTSTFRSGQVVVDVHTVGRGALGYSIVGIAPAERTARLDAVATTLPTGLHYSESFARRDMGRDAGGRKYRINLAQHYPGDLLVPTSDPEMGDATVGLQTMDGAIYYFVMAFEAAAGDDDALDDTADNLLPEDFVEGERSTGKFKVSGHKGRLLTVQGTSEDHPVAMYIGVLPVDEDRHVAIRLWTLGTVDDRRELWRELTDGLSIEALPPLDAFPDVNGAIGDHTPTERALLAAAEEIAVVRPNINHAFLDDRLASVNHEGVYVHGLSDGSARTRSIELGWGAAVLGMDGDTVFVARNDGTVLAVTDDADEEVQLRARLGRRRPDGGWVVGRFMEDPLAERGFAVRRLSEVVAVGPDGSERVLRSRREYVKAVVLDDAGEHVLIAESAGPGWWGDSAVSIVELASGRVQEAGTWTLSDAQPAEGGGFTVVGRAGRGVFGLHRLGLDGKHQLLISSMEVRSGRELSSGDVFLVTGLGGEAENYRDRTDQVLRVPAEFVRSQGAGVEPLSLAGLDAHAHAVLGDDDLGAIFEDASRIRERAAALREAWDPARLGPVPTDDDAVDELVTYLADTFDLPAPTAVMLDVLVIDRLLEHGAEWIGGSSLISTSGSPAGAENDHAVGMLPREVVRSALHDSEGWWNPVTTLRDDAAGRVLVMGDDPERVRARVQELDEGEAPMPGEASDKEVLDYVTKHWANTHLRIRIAEHAARLARWDLLHRVAASEDPAKAEARLLALDVTARLELESDLDEIIADLRASLAEEHNATLLLLLGEAHERSDDPLGKERAEACYQAIVDTFAWSDAADRAREALERLQSSAE